MPKEGLTNPQLAGIIAPVHCYDFNHENNHLAIILLILRLIHNKKYQSLTEDLIKNSVLNITCPSSLVNTTLMVNGHDSSWKGERSE